MHDDIILCIHACTLVSKSHIQYVTRTYIIHNDPTPVHRGERTTLNVPLSLRGAQLLWYDSSLPRGAKERTLPKDRSGVHHLW